MHIHFSESNREKVLGSIKDALGGRKLADMLDFKLGPNTLTVTISKLGTSVLTFAEKAAAAGGLEYELTNEKIAFAHRAFRDEVTEKIVQLIGKAGGKVT